MNHSIRSRGALVLPALVLAALGATEAGAAPGRVTEVRVVSRVGDGAIDDRPKRATARETVVLYAVMTVRQGDRTLYFSDAGEPVTVDGRRRATRPMAEAPPSALRWFKVEPAAESMSNEASGRFRFEPIDYAETEVVAWRGRPSVTADVRPTRTTDRGAGLGTMRFMVVATTGDARVASPGRSARRGRGSGGLTDAVHRVSIRRDDTYLGHLTEMYGQPYIWASAGTSARAHQSERLEGADCADFVIYGWRRMGHDVAYTWTGALPQVTRLISRGRPGEDGAYLDERGRPIPFPEPGDLLLFPRHVGALVADRGTVGVLDREDVMVHAYFATPREQAVGETDYRDAPIEVRRWR